MACAGSLTEDIDLVIVATCSPDSLIPNTASKFNQNLGIKSAAAFDLNAACTGFIYGVETATRLIQASLPQCDHVVGAERLSFFIDWFKGVIQRFYLVMALALWFYRVLKKLSWLESADRL